MNKGRQNVKSCFVKSVLLAVCLFWPSALLAASSNSEFDSANKLYEEGRYAEALAAYDKLLDSGTASTAIYFNRGNALFKMGQSGRAIASYRLAQQLSPRDRDVRANLKFVRERARGGVPLPSNRLHSVLGKLTVNEWAVLTAASLWSLFVLLALGQWRAHLKHTLGKRVIAAGLATLLFGICLGIELNGRDMGRTAIVIAGEADVRNGPLEESPGIYKVRDGAELDVLEQKDNWFQVMDSAQRIGWLRTDQILIFDPAASGKVKL